MYNSIFGQSSYSKMRLTKKKIGPRVPLEYFQGTWVPLEYFQGTRVLLEYFQETWVPWTRVLWMEIGLCLVREFKHMFLVLKQYYMYFHTFFHPHVFPKKKIKTVV